MVTIRLRRMGAKNNAYYRIVVADKRSPRDGRFIEQLGSYDPHKKVPENVIIDGERASYWIDKGAVPSERVRKLLEMLSLV